MTASSRPSLKQVTRTLGKFEGTLSEATGVLGEVRTPLADLQEEMELLRQVPMIAAQVE